MYLNRADYLIRQIMYLSVIVTFLAAGTIVILTGVTLFIATIVPLWAALLITGAILLGMGGLITCLQLSDKIVLKTPVAAEIIRNGNQ